MRNYQRPTFTVLEMCAEEHIVTESGDAGGDIDPMPPFENTNASDLGEHIWNEDKNENSHAIWNKD